MIPWTCDALLDADERHASPKFRRFRQFFRAEDIQYEDAIELVAFLKAVPIRFAKYIFGWCQTAIIEANRVLKHLSADANVARMVEENALALSEEDGLKCLRAMLEGGWTRGAVPPMVRMSLLSLRDRGMSQAAIGREFGMTRNQVFNATGRVRRGSVADRAMASALLAL